MMILTLCLALAQDAGTVPVGDDGAPLNLGFEDGTLRDWTPEGKAFDKQPVRGDTVNPRRNDMRSNHQGKFWVGTYEIGQDPPQGTLTSKPFKVTRPWGSLMVAGGDHRETRVELVRDSDKKVIAAFSGRNTENLRRVAVDLSKEMGKRIFIRVVDRASGGWGHINYDDFRLHDKKPAVARKAGPAGADVYTNAGLSPEKAAQVMTVPEGFKVTLFAGEPDVRQPIAMAIDHRGRIWVAENFTYPTWVPPGEGNCRILVFDDTNGDGRYDVRKVFIDNLNFISGLEVGFGGVWVGAPPSLLFIPDKDGDDRPDGEPQVLLDGWAHHDTHETLNAFIWGPDGWLYGCHGVFTHSNVGKPGTPENERQRINAGIWRYHPTKHRFEVYGEGTSNPWGVDFNDLGDCFATACVIPHLYHIMPGARYQRQAGKHFNLHTYADFKTIADHRHYIGARPHAGNNRSDAAGGGHAHAGAMVYLGDNWPAEYRGKLFMNNIHGARINMDILETEGNRYVGRHGRDFLLSNDRASQIINLRYGPDGGVMMIDWYDMQQCHTRNHDQHDRSNGRIFKVTFGTPDPVRVDLTRKSNAELAELTLHRNDWYVRHARRILQERGADDVQSRLEEIAFGDLPLPKALRGLWALHVTGGLSEERVLKAMKDVRRPILRGWAFYLSCEDGDPSDAILAQAEANIARASWREAFWIGGGMTRLSTGKRGPLVLAMAGEEPLAAVPDLDLLLWYAAEPLVGENPAFGARLAARTKVPRLRQFIARRMAAGK